MDNAFRLEKEVDKATALNGISTGCEYIVGLLRNFGNSRIYTEPKKLEDDYDTSRRGFRDDDSGCPPGGCAVALSTGRIKYGKD